MDKIREVSWFRTNIDDVDYECEIFCRNYKWFLNIRKIKHKKILFINISEIVWSNLYEIVDAVGYEKIEDTRWFEIDFIKSIIPKAIENYHYKKSLRHKTVI